MQGYYDWTAEPVYNPAVDPINYGLCYGLLRRLSVSSSWGSYNKPGTRSSYGRSFSAQAGGDMAARGCNRSKHIILGRLLIKLQENIM